jgi:DNA-binding GntR family transcriptional regulator
MKKVSLSEKVYDRIKEMLITLVFAPGSSLREQVLADILNVSRTPVREALQRLSYEGWVTVGEKKRVRVLPITTSCVDEIFQIRSLLEPFAAGETMAKGKSRTLAGRLDEVLGVMEQVTGDTIAFAMLDMRFHSLLMENVDNNRLYRLWRTLYEESSRLAIMNLTEDGRCGAVLEEHARMVDAFWKKDESAIILAIDSHLETSRNSLASRLGESADENPSGGDDGGIYRFLRKEATEREIFEAPAPGKLNLKNGTEVENAKTGA